jgi:hypothetical protein
VLGSKADVVAFFPAAKMMATVMKTTASLLSHTVQAGLALSSLG